jgi:hypothetical protein
MEGDLGVNDIDICEERAAHACCFPVRLALALLHFTTRPYGAKVWLHLQRFRLFNCMAAFSERPTNAISVQLLHATCLGYCFFDHLMDERNR